MTAFDLVLLPFPFTDLRSTKQRPCLVLASFQPAGLPKHYIVAMVTSQLTGLSLPGDALLREWRAAGLPKPSLVRLAKVVTIEESLIRRKLGTVRGSDRPGLRRRFREVFSEVLAS